VNAGPTPFAPGPVIGELGSIGIKTGIEGGKIVIKSDTVVVKEGQKIDAKVAGLLTRLGITPMDIGLNLIAVYEDGTIYGKEILSVDEKQFMEDIMTAARYAVNLSVEAGFPTKDTMELMISSAFRNARALALSEDIVTDATVGDIFAKAERQMLSVKEAAKIDLTTA
jgi:large subunit ribosomal protein L10